MARNEMRPARANGSGLGVAKLASFDPSNTTPTHNEQGVRSLQAYRLQRRFGLNAATAKLLSSHAFGDREDDVGSWISLAEATAARAMAVGSVS